MLNNSDIWTFLGLNNISVSIKSRGDDHTENKFLCMFHAGSDTANIRDGSFLRGIHGDGATPNEAFTNMCKLCSGKKIEFGNWTDGVYTPIKVQFPILI